MKAKTKPSRSLGVWRVFLNDGDWYDVFATSSDGAIKTVLANHYEMSRGDFMKTYAPAVRRRRDDEKMCVNCEDEGKQIKTAKEWCDGESPGLFCSNTYEW